MQDTHLKYLEQMKEQVWRKKKNKWMSKQVKL